MSTEVRLSLVALFAFNASFLGCGTTPPEKGLPNGGSGNSGGTSSGGSSANGGKGGGVVIPPVNVANCGNSSLDDPEQCDDGNTNGTDGCSALCQIEADYTCPTPGQPCVSSAVCGNGSLSSAEACDDGNTADGDGCNSTCTAVDPGWQCRVPGKKCVPLCGDGVLTGSENCDDTNNVSGDGCSSTCLTEPGWSCTTGVCIQSDCGNGTMEAGESCDAGADNGLFYGDGTGCSKTCTREPTCRDGTGVTTACSTACGDANVDTSSGEQCDDGNGVDGDGCSATCMLEGGFTCTDADVPDTEPCPSNPALQCLVLPIIFRDFEGQQVSGGHPDFFFMGATGATGTPGVIGTKTACVPNASGTRAPYTAGDACPSTDAVGPCTGIAGPTLNEMGKPVLAKDTCPCIFTDWDQTGVLAGVPGTAQCWVENDGTMRDRVDAMVKVVKDAASFAQWYTTSTMSTEVRGTLELAQTAAGQYQFSSSIPGAPAGSVGRTVVDDIHDNCLGTAAPLQSGFFPLDMATGAGATKVCNLWPYWKTGLNLTNCVATAGNPIQAQWDPLAAWDACPMTGTGGFVPNASGTGTLNGMPHNFYFTTEARYVFRYDAPATLEFFGDDDVWVYVNGRLALDLGGPHERVQGSVLINDTFGLEVGKIYEIAVFHADRHPRESNYQLTLSGFATTLTSCLPTCGDSVATAGEECDDGPNNVDGVYGACTTMCKFGPFCGDGVTDAPNEECDQGRSNNAIYGTQGGCTSACLNAHYCGDGILDAGFGEACDQGANNSPTGQCTPNCQLQIK